MEVVYRNDAPTYPSNYTASALMPDNKVVLTRSDTWRFYAGNLDAVCLDKFGNEAWTYPLGYGVASFVLATTDNRIYIAVNDTNPRVIALDHAGGFVWRYDFTSGSAARAFSEMRIFGDNLMVSGTGRTIPNGTGPRSILISLNRQTGAPNYAREYLVNGVPYNVSPKIRSGIGFLYLLVGKAPNIASAVMKINPATGDVVGSYVVGIYKINDFQVDSTGAFYTVGQLNGVDEVRKVNGSGTGNFPMIYRKPNGGEQILLSSGGAYIIARHSVTKLRVSDGAALWQRTYIGREPWDIGFMYQLRADQYGRLYLMWGHNDIPTDWRVSTLDPVTGQDISTYRVDGGNPDHLPVGLMVNTYGEAFTFGQFETYDPEFSVRGGLVRLAQPMVVNNDLYLVTEGQTFTTNGSGLIANDRYINPAYVDYYRINGAGPEQGELTLQTTGEFTYIPKNGAQNVPVGDQVFRYVAFRSGSVSEGHTTLRIVQGPVVFAMNTPAYGPKSVPASIQLSSNGLPSTVTLTSNNPLATVPASITIPTDTNLKAFAIVVNDHVASETHVTLTASLNGITLTRILTILPVHFSTFHVTNTATGGDPVELTIRTNGVAPPGGVTVNISDNSDYFSAPNTATIPAGSSVVVVQATTTAVPSNQTVRITIADEVYSTYRNLTLKPMAR